MEIDKYKQNSFNLEIVLLPVITQHFVKAQDFQEVLSEINNTRDSTLLSGICFYNK